MYAQVFITPDNVWGYFQSHKDELLKESKLIACEPEYGTEVHLSVNGSFPSIEVTQDGYDVSVDCPYSAEECEHMATEVYDNYIFGDVIGSFLDVECDGEHSECDELSTEEELYIIDEREDELKDSVLDMLVAFAPNFLEIADNPDGICEDLVNNIAEYLFTKCGISVYRPMYVEDENGNDEFLEFPYPEIEL